MKRLLCLLTVLLLLPGLCLAEDSDLYVKTYPMSESGEAIINDVTFSDSWQADDNNRVFYEIFVGSFSDSDGDGVGDLRGIINRMDYLNDGDPTSGLSLGVEGLWLTPIFTSPSYHKYDVTDYYEVDPQFGTMADLQELIDLCHERDVKIILDLPINHTGKQNSWFRNFCSAHLMQNPASQHYDFYTWLAPGEAVPAGRHFTRVPGGEILYEANFSDDMPELNFDNEAVRQEMLKVAMFYLDMGVDGFRFDAAKYIYYSDHARNVDFWDWYIGEMRKVKPDVYTVAEVWDGDGVIDRYLPVTNCFHFPASQTGGIIAKTAQGGDVNRFTAYMENYLSHVDELSDHAQGVLFISNHDMDRSAGYLSMASGRMKVAASLYLLSPGSPFIYYGEEIGLRGSRGGANTDANRRLAMFWGDGDTVSDPEGSTYAKQTPYSVKDLAAMSDSVLNHYKQLIMIRKANPEIARGEYRALKFTDTKVGGFTAAWEGRTVAVLHNTTNRACQVDLAQATDTLFETIAAVAGAGQATLEGTVLTIDGQTSVVLR
ncbi:MAG: hypothetical protein IJA77_06735 [Clostridia bacterium]|nr:hypothetical protein [Clostridia bacterium]